MEDQDQLWTETQLKERWACSAGWLANLRSDGKGPRFVKLGALVRYPLEGIRDFETAATVYTADAPQTASPAGSMTRNLKAVAA